MKYKTELENYFENFSNKNISKLEEMFSQDITLKDWNISVSGKENVLDANKNIFDSVESIKVTPIAFYSNSDTSYAVRILILVNQTENLNVIDVIDFDDSGLIKSIVAFKYEN
jgi:hypothetical protein